MCTRHEQTDAVHARHIRWFYIFNLKLLFGLDDNNNISKCIYAVSCRYVLWLLIICILYYIITTWINNNNNNILCSKMSRDVKNACSRYAKHFLYNITTTNSAAERGGGIQIYVYRWHKRVVLFMHQYILLCIVDGTMAGVLHRIVVYSPS